MSGSIKISIEKFLKPIDKIEFVGYNISGDKRRLIVWKLYVSVKRGSPYR